MLIPFEYLFNKYKITSTEVCHVGSNDGAEAEQYLALGIKRIVWVEAHEPTFQKLVAHIGSIRHGPNEPKRFDHCQKGRVTFHNGAIHVCINACVSDTDGQPVTFHVANNSSQSSSILELGTHTTAHPSVTFVEDVPMRTQRLDTLLAEFVPFQPGAFLNIDLQGAELLALRGLGDLLNQFDALYLEINERELYKTCALVGEVDAWLAERGFSRVQTKMEKAGWGDALYLRNKK